MSNFIDVIKQASVKRQEKEVNYRQVRDERWQELKELAEESDRLLDGRSRRRKRIVNG